MINRPLFSSSFSSLISTYLDYKARNGFNEESYYLGLKKFDRFLCSINKEDETFTKEDAELWTVLSDTESECAHYKRLEVSRGFLLYLHMTGKNVYVFRPVKYPQSNFMPHIYTEDEIERYFEAVDTYPFRGWKDRLQMPVLCRLLYTCGTRLGETLQIRKRDVNLDKGVIRYLWWVTSSHDLHKWEVETTHTEVNHVFEVFHISEASGFGFDEADFRVKSLQDCIGFL